MTHPSGVRFAGTDLEVTSGRGRRLATVDDREHLTRGATASSTGPLRLATVPANAGPRGDAPHKAMS